RGVILVTTFLVSSIVAQDAFIKKYSNLVSDYLGPNTAKLVNLIGDGVVALKTSDQIMEDVKAQAFGFVPKTKFPSALVVLQNYDTCQKNSGSKNPNASIEAMTFAFNKFILPLAKKVTTKAATMKKNKKADKAVKTEVYKIATAGLTKKLMQNFLNAMKTKMTAAEHACSVPVCNEFMATKHYDMTWKKSG
ncbi:hypothetical protein PFISCL1PPCAC_12612, partial [Pristionchus fissidentatus]